MRDKIIKAISDEKIITIVRGVPKDKLSPLAEAMYEGGIRLMEITYDATGSIADETTADYIRMLAQHMEGRMYIGAGTVLKEAQVELTKNAGGGFIISPDTNPDIIKKTRDLEMISIPGALTPSEVQQAHLCGADFVKLFPIDAMGTAYVKAITAPLSHIRLLAVGGVNTDNIGEYIKSGVCGIGIGSGIINKAMLSSGDYASITQLAQKYVTAISVTGLELSLPGN